jgi:hypothetical protein
MEGNVCCTIWCSILYTHRIACMHGYHSLAFTLLSIHLLCFTALHDSKHDGFKLINQSDLWPTPFYPATELLVSYESSTVSVLCGNILRPRTVEHPPSAIQHYMKDQSSHLLYRYRASYLHCLEAVK